MKFTMILNSRNRPGGTRRPKADHGRAAAGFWERHLRSGGIKKNNLYKSQRMGTRTSGAAVSDMEALLHELCPDGMIIELCTNVPA